MSVINFDALRTWRGDCNGSRRSLLASTLGTLVALVALTSFAGASPAVAETAVSATSAQALVPSEIKKSGVLKVAMPLDFEPYNFLDSKNQPVGFDVDIFRAIAKVLGVKSKIDRLAFASIIPAISGGRVDAGMSVIGILPARLHQVSFVRYTVLANGLIVRTGNPTKIKTNDACGHTIAVEKGTQPVVVWEKISKQCEADGRKQIKLMMFDGEGPQVLAVETGRADAAGVSFATAIVAAKHSDGKFAAAPGGPVPGATVDAGIAFKKGSTQLGKALEAALKVVIADGTYKMIMDKWELSGTAAEPAIFK